MGQHLGVLSLGVLSLTTEGVVFKVLSLTTLGDNSEKVLSHFRSKKCVYVFLVCVKNSFSAFGSKKEKRQLVLSSVVIQNLDNTGACFPGQFGPASLPEIYDTTYCNHVVGDRKRCLVSIIG